MFTTTEAGSTVSHDDDDPRVTRRGEGAPAVMPPIPEHQVEEGEAERLGTIESVLEDYWFLPDDVRERLGNDLRAALSDRVLAADRTTDKYASESSFRPHIAAAQLRAHIAAFLGGGR